MKYFFFLSMGRTGTRFLAALLGKAPGTLVYHEPVKEDRVYFGLRYAGNFDRVVDNYLERRFRDLIASGGKHKVYGEINSYLRCEADWLKKKFDPVLFHLVRDGRDFVRSAYTRDVYTPREKKLVTVPKDHDPYADKWDKMTRFRKLCWYWKHSNEFLLSKIDRTVLLEKLLTDYDYFKDNVLSPLGLNIPFNTWQTEVKKPRNTSKKNILRKKVKGTVLFWKKEALIKPLPHWTRWNKIQIRQFNEICGETMEKLGYRLDNEGAHIT